MKPILIHITFLALRLGFHLYSNDINFIRLTHYSDKVVMIYYLPLVLVQTVLGFGNPSTEQGNVMSCPTMACISLGS